MAGYGAVGGVPGGGGGGGGSSNGGTAGKGGDGGTGGNGLVRVWTVRGTGADLAEIYSTRDTDLAAGDVVALDPEMQGGVKKSSGPYDPLAIGIVSTQPSLIMGANENPGTHSILVALAGRVPVKVSKENGDIQPGDLLTPSSIPGVAMKATKAGVIIGQATTWFDDRFETDVELVVAFVRTDFSHGAKLATLLPEGLAETEIEKPPNSDFGRALLLHLASARGDPPEQPPGGVNLSEVFTDRMAAALEIISPRVLTNTLIADSIEAVDKDIGLRLSDGGKFNIFGDTVLGSPSVITEDIGLDSTSSPADAQSATGSPVISFDSLGNAFFAGELTAAKIKANEITGLEIITSKLSALETTVDDFTASQSVSSSTDSAMIEIQDGLEMQDASTTVDIDIEDPSSLELTDATLATLNISGLVTFSNGLRVDSIAALSDTLNLMSDVSFFGRPYFNTDTAGFAAVKQGQRSVDIGFEKEYLEQPIVNATISLDAEGGEEAIFNENISYLVTRKSATGFTILLNKPAPVDIQFSWIALAVKNPKTFFSLKEEVNTQPIGELAPQTIEEPLPEPVVGPEPQPVSELEVLGEQPQTPSEDVEPAPEPVVTEAVDALSEPELLENPEQ